MTKDIIDLLNNQQDIKYLTWSILVNRKTGEACIELNTLGIEKKFYAKDENTCRSKLIDVLLEMKDLEKWKLTKLNKGYKNVRSSR